jgi:hypothetical protein
MPNEVSYPILSPNLQVGFYHILNSIKELYFHEALSRTVRKIRVSDIDRELQLYVSNEALSKLASFSLRGEAVFPLPIILRENPFLLGYYRLLLGVSQKEFYSKGPFGAFKMMEEKGVITKLSSNKIESLCRSLIATSESFVSQIDLLNITTLSELQILTVGPQLRGSKNNEYGHTATRKTFDIIKELVKDYISSTSINYIDIINDSDRKVSIAFSSDPDIEISEKMPSGRRGLISIEIKGGRDISNIHNRIGEAEKSHQKAKKRGYFEFMTIISVDVDYAILKSESPTTNHFFHLDKISNNESDEYVRFKDLLSSILSVRI